MKTGQHVKVENETLVGTSSLRKRIGIAAVSGCLALSMLPAVALADDASTNDPTQGSKPPAMQQNQAPAMPQGQAPNGQAPEAGQQAPAMPQGQAPSADNNQMGQPPAMPQGQAPSDQTSAGNPPAQPNRLAPAANTNVNSDNAQTPNVNEGQTPNEQQPGMAPTNEIDSKIIDAIDDETIKELARKGNVDTENKRPAIPEGEVNVAQLLDSIRQSLMENKLIGNLVDKAGKLKDAPDASQAPEINGDTTAPSKDSQDTQAGNTTGKTTNDESAASSQAPTLPDNSTAADKPAAPTGDDTSSLPLFQQILAKVVEFFHNLL